MKKSKSKITEETEGTNMATMTKPVSNRMAVVKQENSREFVREFNKNKVSAEFLKSCKKAGKLFGRDK